MRTKGGGSGLRLRPPISFAWNLKAEWGRRLAAAQAFHTGPTKRGRTSQRKNSSRHFRPETRQKATMHQTLGMCTFLIYRARLMCRHPLEPMLALFEENTFFGVFGEKWQKDRWHGTWVCGYRCTHQGSAFSKADTGCEKAWTIFAHTLHVHSSPEKNGNAEKWGIEKKLGL